MIVPETVVVKIGQSLPPVFNRYEWHSEGYDLEQSGFVFKRLEHHMGTYHVPY
ncbi:MAG: hypothetical protein KDD59_05295 [Bdellovibrionales bacterium]|nr:hypothetical protein [Bdellovibrionales bacterium]